MNIIHSQYSGRLYLEDSKPVSIEGFIYHGEAKNEITPIEG